MILFLQSYIFFNTQNFTEQNTKRAKPGLVKYIVTLILAVPVFINIVQMWKCLKLFIIYWSSVHLIWKASS